MIVQFHSDNSIEAHQKHADYFSASISDALSRFSEQITRVDVHLTDENSHKNGQNDKRCVIEAKLVGMQPIAVTCNANTMEQSVNGAIDKLKSSLDSAVGRLKTH